MSFWWRELGGWLLIGVGMLAFVLAYDFCRGHFLTEAWVVAVVGIVIFWGGIHLLKVAIAARVCRQAQDELYPKINRQNARSTRERQEERR